MKAILTNQISTRYFYPSSPGTCPRARVHQDTSPDWTDSRPSSFFKTSRMRPFWNVADDWPINTISKQTTKLNIIKMIVLVLHSRDKDELEIWNQLPNPTSPSWI